jgi:hypothetical protein
MTANPMLSLTSADRCTNSRGTVFTFEGIPGLDPRKILDQQVIIDGREYTAKGVETYAIYDATGTNFGIAVGTVV